MKTLHKRCAGLDVYKKEVVVACLRLAFRGEASYAVRPFAATTRRLIELADWLDLCGDRCPSCRLLPLFIGCASTLDRLIEARRVIDNVDPVVEETPKRGNFDQMTCSNERPENLGP